MSMPLFLALIAVIAVAAVAFYVYRRTHTLRVYDHELYDIVDRRGRHRVFATTGAHHLRGGEHVVAGARAARFGYPVIAGDGRETTEYLRDETSGAVSLHPQFCSFRFTALTREPLAMSLQPQVQFAVHPAQFHHLRDIGDKFALALTSRIRQAFEGEVGKREDQGLNEDRVAINETVLEMLRQAEMREPLGIEYKTVTFSFQRDMDPHRSHRSGGTAGADVTGLVSASADGSGHPSGVAFMEAAEYDVIMNLFSKDEDRKEVLLAILEMQTRRDIAEALARKGQLVVVTAQELGLATKPAQLEAIRKAAATSAAPGGFARS